MSIARVAGRYAKSIIDLATETGRITDVVADMRDFSEAAKNRDLAMLLKSPIINADKKLSVIDALFAHRYCDLTMGFFRICINKGREPQLPEIATEFLEQYKQMQSITTVKVTSAQPLSQASLEAIRQKLQLSGDTNDTVEVETAIDPNLIGGFVVEFGDKLYDASVSHKLELLKKEFQENPYKSKLFA